MKLELKHLNAYSILESSVFHRGETKQIKGVFYDEDKDNWFVDFYYEYTSVSIDDIQLILSNVKDLDKPYPGISDFVPLNHILDKLDSNFNINDLRNINRVTYEFLIDMNFDIFGLIEQGLAIDLIDLQ